MKSIMITITDGDGVVLDVVTTESLQKTHDELAKEFGDEPTPVTPNDMLEAVEQELCRKYYE